MRKFLFDIRAAYAVESPLSGKRIIKMVCLLVMVGILCVTPRLSVQAASLDD